MSDIKCGKQGYADFLELHILHHATEEQIYGLWMIEELAHHGYRVGPSHLYPKFHRLERQGYLLREDRLVDGKVRKYYRATALGARYLETRKRMVLELVTEAFSIEELEQVIARKRRKERSAQ
ncbi:MAG: helix-turn-helix transcriptional regulator [Bryobacterales bacterium]|nr:helix-turn-helix transcriptional regulator [Bryobacterales bacterium]